MPVEIGQNNVSVAAVNGSVPAATVRSTQEGGIFMSKSALSVSESPVIKAYCKRVSWKLIGLPSGGESGPDAQPTKHRFRHAVIRNKAVLADIPEGFRRCMAIELGKR